MLYSSIAPVTLVFINLVANLSRHIDKIKEIPGCYKLIIPLVARPVRLGDYLSERLRYYYPIEEFELDREGFLRKRFKIMSGLDKRHREYISDLLLKGIVSENHHIWVTYGLPMIFLIYIGLLILILLGDRPILYILDHIL